jgi:hypothetical protein
MPIVDDALSVNLISQAERELAAFFRARPMLSAMAARRKLVTSGSTRWNRATGIVNPEKFFRDVAVRAAAVVCSHFELSDQPKFRASSRPSWRESI